MPRFSLRTLLLVFAAVGGILVLGQLFISATTVVRTPSRMNSCQNKMRQVSIALLNYRDARGYFPPASIYDDQGRPLHSWRVLILPYMEETVAYMKLDLKQPWNSPHNWQVIQSIDSAMFHCGYDHGDRSETNYLAVVGRDTAWPGRTGFIAKSCPDGESNTILLVEVANSGIHWAEPRDLPLDQANLGINPPHVKFAISSDHKDCAGVAFCDGHCEFLEDSTSIDLLQALLTRNGRERIEVDTYGVHRLIPVTQP